MNMSNNHFTGYPLLSKEAMYDHCLHNHLISTDYYADLTGVSKKTIEQMFTFDGYIPQHIATSEKNECIVVHGKKSTIKCTCVTSLRLTTEEWAVHVIMLPTNPDCVVVQMDGRTAASLMSVPKDELSKIYQRLEAEFNWRILGNNHLSTTAR